MIEFVALVARRPTLPGSGWKMGRSGCGRGGGRAGVEVAEEQHSGEVLVVEPRLRTGVEIVDDRRHRLSAVGGVEHKTTEIPDRRDVRVVVDVLGVGGEAAGHGKAEGARRVLSLDGEIGARREHRVGDHVRYAHEEYPLPLLRGPVRRGRRHRLLRRGHGGSGSGERGKPGK